MIPHDLKKLRRKMDMTQEQLAVELCVSQALVSQMERGHSIISKRTEKQLVAIRKEWVRRSHYLQASKITGKSPAELAGGEL